MTGTGAGHAPGQDFHGTVEALNATELHTLKWSLSCHACMYHN